MSTARQQVAFGTLMSHARKVGEMMADTVLAGAPPPWEDVWFKTLYTNCIEQSGVAFQMKFPQASETIIANMQVRFSDGFEGRIKSVLGSGHFLPGIGTGRAN